jgi:nicotinate-nucleotide--dimethylbenzimidazole phosphoribosyltransferase
MSGLLASTLTRLRPGDPEAARATQELLDQKAKPPGSLGRLEALACRLARILGGVPHGPVDAAVVVAAADHGVASERVSAYPREVTGQMLGNFTGGGAAVAVLARHVGARLVVVDAGVAPPPPSGVRSAVVNGFRVTANIVHGPAMTAAVAIGSIEQGVALADELADDGCGLIALGDMGIANTTSASALCAALLPAQPATVCGPGTGLGPAGVARKVDVVRRALEANDLAGRGHGAPIDTLAALGGLEIAYLVGVILGAAARRLPVLLDGFVTGAAALVAGAIAPACLDATIAATRSPEPGHSLVLDRLEQDPLLDLDLRLGEGSAAALAIPLVRSAVAIVDEMATFEEAGISRA